MDYLSNFIAQTFKPVLHMIERLTGFHSFMVCKTFAHIGILQNLWLLFDNAYGENMTEVQALLRSCHAILLVVSIVMFGLIIMLCRQNKQCWEHKVRIFDGRGITKDRWKAVFTMIMIFFSNLFLFKEDPANRSTVNLLFYESLAMWTLFCTCSVKPYFGPSGHEQEERKATAKEGQAWLKVTIVWMVLIYLFPNSTLRILLTILYIMISLGIMMYQIRRRRKEGSPVLES